MSGSDAERLRTKQQYRQSKLTCKGCTYMCTHANVSQECFEKRERFYIALLIAVSHHAPLVLHCVMHRVIMWQHTIKTTKTMHSTEYHGHGVVHLRETFV